MLFGILNASANLGEMKQGPEGGSIFLGNFL